MLLFAQKCTKIQQKIVKMPKNGWKLSKNKNG
jgi:hypothetical protein